MQRYLIRIVIAIIAFSAGVAAATIFNGVFGASSPVHRFESSRPFEPSRRRPCPNTTRVLSDLPPLPLIDPTTEKRISVKLPDGTVRVVESRREVERKETQRTVKR